MVSDKKAIFLKKITLIKYERLIYLFKRFREAFYMTFNFNTGVNYNLYTDPTNTTSQSVYTTNPMMSMATSIFAMMQANNSYNTPAAAYALGGFSNIGTMNGDLITPQWMQDLTNPYKLNQYDFSQLYTYNPFMQGMTGTANSGTSNVNPYMGSYTNPNVLGSNYANAADLAQNYANAMTLAQNYSNPFAISQNYTANNGNNNTGATANQGQAINETTQKLNMYGISSTGDAEKDKKALATAEAKQNRIEAEAAEIAEDLYVAMKGAGTDNNKLKSAVSKINKDNILYVLEAWNTNFADSMDGETLIESIQNEHWTGWFGHQQEDLENHIANALFQKGQELGLKTESHAFRAKVNAEHSAWFTSDSVINNAFNNIIEKIATKDAEVRTEKAQKAYQNNK